MVSEKNILTTIVKPIDPSLRTLNNNNNKTNITRNVANKGKSYYSCNVYRNTSIAWHVRESVCYILFSPPMYNDILYARKRIIYLYFQWLRGLCFVNDYDKAHKTTGRRKMDYWRKPRALNYSARF